MARAQEPHHLAHYALDLATAFHVFYDRQRVVTDDPALTGARLKLVKAGKGGAGTLPGPHGHDRPGAHVGWLRPGRRLRRYFRPFST